MENLFEVRLGCHQNSPRYIYKQTVISDPIFLPVPVEPSKPPPGFPQPKKCGVTFQKISGPLTRTCRSPSRFRLCHNLGSEWIHIAIPGSFPNNLTTTNTTALSSPVPTHKERNAWICMQGTNWPGVSYPVLFFSMNIYQNYTKDISNKDLTRNRHFETEHVERWQNATKHKISHDFVNTTLQKTGPTAK